MMILRRRTMAMALMKVEHFEFSPVDDRLPVLCQTLHPRWVQVHTVREELAVRLPQKAIKFPLDWFFVQFKDVFVGTCLKFFKSKILCVLDHQRRIMIPFCPPVHFRLPGCRLSRLSRCRSRWSLRAGCLWTTWRKTKSRKILSQVSETFEGSRRWWGNRRGQRRARCSEESASTPQTWSLCTRSWQF